MFDIKIKKEGRVFVFRSPYAKLALLGTSGISPTKPLAYSGPDKPLFIDEIVVTCESADTETIVAILGCSPNPKKSYSDSICSVIYRIRSKETSSPGNGAELEAVYPWVPCPDRLGQVYGYGVQVLIDGEFYSSDRAHCRKEGNTFVPDGNLLCRYLVKKAEKKDIIAVVEEQKTEVSLKQELERMQNKLGHIEGLFAQQSKLVQEKDGEIETLKERLRFFNRVMVNIYNQTMEIPFGHKGKRLKFIRSIADKNSK